MSKVTRIAYSEHLNQGKYNRLVEIARRLGKVRAEVWRRYGSVQGVGLTHRGIRDGWMAEDLRFDVPARLWKESLRDTFDDIGAYRESAKVKVRKAIRRHTQDDGERKRLYTLLKKNEWLEDGYLRRMMRKHYKHGRTQVDNQIILDTDCYTAFERNGRAWIEVMSLVQLGVNPSVVLRLQT